MRMVRFAKGWRNWLAGVLLLASAGAGGEARADGKVLPPVLVAQEIEMPDQRALLAWKDGVETLVIESSFVGEGTDFAWVVPLPAKPEVEAATRGTLPSVAALMLPVVRPANAALWKLILVCGITVVVAALCGWQAVGWCVRIVAVAGAGAVAGLILDAILNLWPLFTVVGIVLACVAGRRVIKNESSLLVQLASGLVGLLLFGLTIPSFGKVRSLGSGAEQEAAGLVLDRRVVGDFDLVLLSGRDGADVVRWLADNGFALPEAARTEAERHAAAGGWFAASKVRRDFAERGKSVPAPLVFRFPCERPIYPMRFTGAGATEPLEVELFVFGPERAVTDALESRAWGPVEFREPDENAHYRRGTGQPDDARMVNHPQLRRLAEGTAMVTHLRGKLSPTEMQADLVLRWVAGGSSAKGLVAYAPEAAWQRGIMAGVGLALIAMIVLGLIHGGQCVPSRWSLPSLAVGAVLTCLVVWWIPVVPVREAKDAIPWHVLRQIDQVGMMFLLDGKHKEADTARVQAMFAEELALAVKPEVWTPSFGDGPGQIEISAEPGGGWRFTRYDMAGQTALSITE